jgi:hypothetical protein
MIISNISFYERVYWNKKSYGRALKIKKNHIVICFIVACIITPFTNWIIPFIGKIIKNDIIIRY